MAKILIAEDERPISELVKRNLMLVDVYKRQGQPRRRGALTKAGKRGARRSLCGRKRLCGMTALAPAHAKRLAALCGPASVFCTKTLALFCVFMIE